jgi:hypothetical protein
MEWRLAGFELLTTRDDQAGVGGVAPGGVGERSGPEVKQGGWGVLREQVVTPTPLSSGLTYADMDLV